MLKYQIKKIQILKLILLLILNNNNILVLQKKEDKNINNIRTKAEEENLAIILIKANIDQSPSYHINNLNNNNIYWNKKKIENLVYKLQEENYPAFNQFLKNINSQHVYIGESETESNKFNICPKKVIFINTKNNNLEHLIFITTNFQLNLLSECNIIFIDGTFRSASKSFYKVLNMIGQIY